MPKPKIPANEFGDHYSDQYVDFYKFADMISYKGISPEIWLKLEEIVGQKMGDTPHRRIDHTLMGFCMNIERCENGINTTEFNKVRDSGLKALKKANEWLESLAPPATVHHDFLLKRFSFEQIYTLSSDLGEIIQKLEEHPKTVDPRRFLLHRFAAIWKSLTGVEPKAYFSAYDRDSDFIRFVRLAMSQLNKFDQDTIKVGLTDVARSVLEERKKGINRIDFKENLG